MTSYGHARRADRLDVGPELRGDRLRVLVGHEPEAQLRAGHAGQDRLGPGPLVAAVEAVDVAGRPGPLPLQGRVAGLALQRGDAQARLELGLRERQPGELGPLPVLQRADRVVEAGDPDAAVGPLQARQDRRQGVARVGDRAAEGAGVEVGLRPPDDHLEVGQPLQAVGDRRHAGGELAGVGDHGVVAGEPVARCSATKASRLAPPTSSSPSIRNLTFTGRRAARLEPGLGGLQVGEHLPLVVGGAAGVEVAVADGRLERGRESRAPAARGAGRRNGRRPGASACRGRRGARRRRAGAPWSRSARRRGPSRARSSRTNSAARRVSASWSGWALTLGMRSRALSCSSKSPRCASR